MSESKSSPESLRNDSITPSENGTQHGNDDKTVSMTIPNKTPNGVPPNSTVGRSSSPDDAIDPDDELLVAYLDGEVSGRERELLEDRLVAEEPLRLRLQALQRGWDMLDELPTPVVDERSVQTTLEMVVADLTRASQGIEPVGERSAAVDDDSAKSPMSKWTKRWIAVAGFALVASLIAAFTWQNISYRQEIADLPIAIDHQAYSSTDDLELIRDLAKSPRWYALANHSANKELEHLVDELGGTEELVQAIAELDDDQRSTAYRRWDTFQNMTDRAKDITRERAKRVATSPDADELLQTMRAYSRWKEQLSRDTLAAIENETGVAREIAIQDGVHETMNVIGRLTAKGLSDESVERIAFTMQQIVQQRIADKEPAALRMMEGFKEHGGKDEDRKWAYHFIAHTIISDASRWRRSSRGKKRGPESPPLTLSELHQIETMLPEGDLELLRTVSTDTWFRSMVLRDWVEESLRRRGRPDSEMKTLQEAYQETSADERELLDLLPPEETRDQLLRP
ncbi:anti-sigma factor [Rhodopirellula halodulae]|uniref:anti-sigma factor n=1 Tax=Rhodopirellula halodulae TaxID=2894198 RepID=UPI001E3C8E05|nr:hypothetical protein [Rhodopirellula sp. JC737]MCC9655618.1 hypothetical protein [Rhodopirellula sp. JC737]